MIFVSVGTHYQSFDRLIKAMDELAENIQEEVVIQTGYSKYEPRKATWFRFCTDPELKNDLQQASVVVAHAGAGTAIDVLSLGKPLVIVPRRAMFYEHVDDQQIELSEALGRSGKAIIVEDVSELSSAIAMARGFKPTSSGNGSDLISFLKGEIDHIGSRE